MIISQLTGGVGNQMFQYALGRSLSLKFNSKLYLDILNYQWDELREFGLEAFNIEVSIADKKLIDTIKKEKPSIKTRLRYKLKSSPIPSFYYPYFKEVNFSFNNEVLLVPNGNVYLEGYWQSEKYFAQYRSEILKDFTLKKSLGEKSNFYKNIILNSKESVSVHVRRGDYIQNPETTAFHGVCGLEYYRDAIGQLKKELTDTTFFIFSDDKEFVKKSFIDYDNCVFIEDVELDVEELVLMSLCDHNIIANSSFSWWGAWLNKNDHKIVVSPKQWFQKNEMQAQTKDLIPPTWRRI